MKILKLYSDLVGFNTIEFNPSGFTFVVGEENKDRKSTYNGTGKTLMIALIDFCLGSNSRKELEILKCNFFLDFKQNNKFYTIKRSTIEQNNVFVNDEKMPLKKFKKFLTDLLSIQEEKNVSLRTKLSLFCRYKKTAFINALDCGDGATEFQHLLNIFHELGFDTSLIHQKNTMNLNLSTSKKVVRQLSEKDLKNVLTDSQSDVEVEKLSLESKIKEKEEQLKNLKLADNIADLKAELSRKRTEYNKVLNDLVVTNKNIDKVNKSLSNNIFTDEEKLIAKYTSFREIFKDNIIKDIDDVVSFHKDLIQKRAIRQNNELHFLKAKVDSLEKQKNILKERIDEIYFSLSNTIDLAELNAISNEITNLKIKYNKLLSYSKILKQQENVQINIKRNLLDDDIAAQKYLDDNEGKIRYICKKFNEFANCMYGKDKNSFVSLKNNTNTCSVRYNMTVKIPNDGSDGISNAEIICFDLMLNAIGISQFGFIIHDNKVFYGIDFSVVAKLFKKLYADNIDFQYILTINQSEYDEIKKEFNDDELFNVIVENNIKARLTGNNKLLGKTIDLGIVD